MSMQKRAELYLLSNAVKFTPPGGSVDVCSARQNDEVLRLALSKKLVELHGGRIWADSELGEGSTFTLPVRA